MKKRAELVARALKSQLLSVQQLKHELRNDLLRELSRAIDIVRSDDQNWHIVRMDIGMNEHLGRGLGGRIGIRRLQKRRLSERSPCCRMILPINLVGTNVNESSDLAIGTAGLEQRMRPNDVVLRVQHWIRKGRIDVALGRKVDHRVNGMLYKEPVKQFTVLDVPLHKHIVVLGLGQIWCDSRAGIQKI